MSQHLSFPVFGKAAGGQAKVRTGLGKSDRPGSQGGLWKRGLNVVARHSSIPTFRKRVPSPDLVPTCSVNN